MTNLKDKFLKETGINVNEMDANFARQEEKVQLAINFILRNPKEADRLAVKFLGDPTDADSFFAGVCIRCMIILAAKWTWDLADTEPCGRE